MPPHSHSDPYWDIDWVYGGDGQWWHIMGGTTTTVTNGPNYGQYFNGPHWPIQHGALPPGYAGLNNGKGPIPYPKQFPNKPPVVSRIQSAKFNKRLSWIKNIMLAEESTEWLVNVRI
jgi:hypothetical protein